MNTNAVGEFVASSDGSNFLDGGGEMAALISAYDWSQTPLGPLETWPQSLRTATAILLRSPVPIVMLWGEDGIMIYNDAYSVFAGGRHPRLLGSKVREGWPEVADFNDNVMKVGLSGGTLAYRDQELTLYRTGKAEQVWMNLDYSPVLDESGKPAGVIAIVVETTEKVLAERRIVADRERLTQMFEQAPGLMAMLRGPDHIFELANPAYMQLVGHRDVSGKPVREALPEIEGQGFFELLDNVYGSGEAFVGAGMRVMLRRAPDGPAEDRFVDFVYQPITDADGTVSGIFVEGADVTERKRAEALQTAQKRALELTVADAPLVEVLEMLVRTAEAESSSGMLGSILLPDPDGLHLRHGAAPNLPKPYNDAINGIAIGPEAGSCGTAAFRKKPVYVSDVATDPLWKDFRHLALSHDLRACWSTPILSGPGELLGTFAMYYRQPQLPAAEDIELVDIVTRTAALVIERKRSEQALRASEERFRAFVNASSDVVYRMSPDWREMRHLDGRGFIADTPDPSQNWLEMYIHTDDQPRVVEAINEAIRAKSPFELEHRVRRVDGTFGWTFSRAIPLLDERDEITEWFGAAGDVTERKQAEEALRLSEERFRSVFEHSSEAIFVLDPERNAVLEANPAAVSMFGYDSREELLATPLSKFHPDDLPSFLEFVQSVHEDGASWTDEFACRAKGDRRVTSEISASTLTIDGRRCLLALVRDIGERKQAEQHQKLLLDELNHRVKNTLATVQAIAAQTFRGEAADPEARAAFEARLFALSQAHSLLTRENWESVELRDMAAQALEAFQSRTGESDRFTIEEGDDIRLRPKVALALGMAFHELATNAAKYGALSNGAGRVTLSWQLEPKADRLRVRWQESGGPPVKPPTRKGFGSRLIERGLAQELGGQVDLNYYPAGVSCVIDMPAPEDQ